MSTAQQATPRHLVEVNVPPEMLEARRWICWRNTPDKDKVPSSTRTGGTIDALKKVNWRSVLEALRAVPVHNLKGVGFVTGGRFALIDLDHCRNKETGELRPWAAAIVDLCDSYTEVSPSGEGLHIWLLVEGGDVAGFAAITTQHMDADGYAKVEVFTAEKYGTVTGERLEGAPRSLALAGPCLAKLRQLYFTDAEPARQRPTPAAAPTRPADMDRDAKARHWVDWYLAHPTGGRNDTNAAIARQLRDDARLSLAEAEPYALDYQRQVERSGDHPYTEVEALATLRSIYSRPPRDEAVSLRQPAQVTPLRPSAPRRPAPADALETPAAEAQSADAPADAPPSKRKKLPITKMVADAITELGEHFAVDVGGRLWIYRDGVYRPNGKTAVQRLVKSLLTGPMGMPEHWSTHQSDEVVAYIAVDAPELWERPPVDRVNVRNGLLDLATSTLKPHSPDFLSPVQLPMTYDPAATCPHWDRFIASTFPEDAQPLAWEIFAWLMTPDTSIQKAILLLGEGGNGKSTYLAGVIAFLGKLNTSAIPLQKLETDRFVTSRLVGKLANVCADLPSAALVGTSMFKAITCGDPITAEDKFKASFDLTPFARLLFSANTPPQSPDATQAFYDRWVAIPFTGRFRGEAGEIDRATLDAQLADPAELAGVLNKALAVLPQLRQRRRFTEAASVKAELAHFREVTDPLTIWLDTHTIEDADAITPKEKLFQAYAKHARKEGRPSGTNNAFSRALKRARPSVGDAQRMVNGKLTHVWVGIGLTSSSPDDDSQDSQHSRDLASISYARTRPLIEEEETSRITGVLSSNGLYKGNPVNAVNPVKVDTLHCDHPEHARHSLKSGVTCGLCGAKLDR